MDFDIGNSKFFFPPPPSSSSFKENVNRLMMFFKQMSIPDTSNFLSFTFKYYVSAEVFK